MKKVVTIQPITRLEGHGKISIFLDEDGDVKDAYYQVVEFRGFERFCIGRPVEEMPLITPRICGVCPWAHHMASAKAVDAVYGAELPETARKIRELAYNIFYIHDHSAVFYALSAPDFIVGPDAPRTERNILGLIGKVGLETGKKVINARMVATKLLEKLAGRAIIPICAVPGGVSKPLMDDDRKEIEEGAKKLVEFGQFTLKIFEDVVLKNQKYLDLILGDVYKHETYYMGLVDDKGLINYYDGKVRVVDPKGRIYAEFYPKDYLNYISEHVEPWTYLKFPYLKGLGWKGIVDGEASGVYRVGPLGRLNVADGFATPIAHEAYEKFKETLGKPAHATLGYHWARVIEILNAAERVLELSKDPDITGKDFRVPLTNTPSEGVGIVEAPRGTLIHHYKTDQDGILTDVNLIVATTHNNAGICMSVKKASQQLIKGGNISDGLLNMIEMAFRAYDPCLACGTHALPGQMPLDVCVYDVKGRLVAEIKRP